MFESCDEVELHDTNELLLSTDDVTNTELNLLFFL